MPLLVSNLHSNLISSQNVNLKVRPLWRSSLFSFFLLRGGLGPLLICSTVAAFELKKRKTKKRLTKKHPKSSEKKTEMSSFV